MEVFVKKLKNESFPDVFSVTAEEARNTEQWSEIVETFIYHNSVTENITHHVEYDQHYDNTDIYYFDDGYTPGTGLIIGSYSISDDICYIRFMPLLDVHVAELMLSVLGEGASIAVVLCNTYYTDLLAKVGFYPYSHASISNCTDIRFPNLNLFCQDVRDPFDWNMEKIEEYKERMYSLYGYEGSFGETLFIDVKGQKFVLPDDDEEDEYDIIGSLTICINNVYIRIAKALSTTTTFTLPLKGEYIKDPTDIALKLGMLPILLKDKSFLFVNEPEMDPTQPDELKLSHIPLYDSKMTKKGFLSKENFSLANISKYVKPVNIHASWKSTEYDRLENISNELLAKKKRLAETIGLFTSNRYYETINGAFQHSLGQPYKPTKNIEEYKKYQHLLKDMVKIFKYAPKTKENIVLLRGSHVDYIEKEAKYHFQASVTSTSKDLDENFVSSDDHCCRYIIMVPVGIPILSTKSKNVWGEAEFLLPPGTVYEIIQRSPLVLNEDNEIVYQNTTVLKVLHVANMSTWSSIL